MSNEFKKYDDGKLRWDKFAWLAAACALRIFHYGAKKYDWDNWRNARGENNTRMLTACMRHLIKSLGGEKFDPESGYPHTWHALCTLLMYVENEEKTAPPAPTTMGDGGILNISPCPDGWAWCHGTAMRPGQKVAIRCLTCANAMPAKVE
jgi:hypothetical protein